MQCCTRNPDPDAQLEEDIVHIKCVMIGDGTAGKSYAMTRWCRDIVRTDYVPTMFDNDLKDILVTKDNKEALHPSLTIGQTVRLDCWETAGQPDLKYIRTQSYSNTDVVLMAFDLTNPESLHNLVDYWLPEKNKYMADAATVIGGMKLDLSRGKVRQVDIENLVEKANAAGYKPCSTYTREGLDDLFTFIINTVISKRTEDETSLFSCFKKSKVQE